MTSEARLAQLVQGPIFGPATFAALPAGADLLHLLHTVTRETAQTLAPILRVGMPEASADGVRGQAAQIARRISALCTLIGPELDVPALVRAACVIGVMNWGDTLVDGGDAAMARAVALLLCEHGQADLDTDAIARSAPADEMLIQARLQALRAAIPLLPAADRGPLLVRPYLRFLAGAVELDWLATAKHANSHSFWAAHTPRWAAVCLSSIQLGGCAAVVYGLLRERDLRLPPVQAALDDPAIQSFVDRVGSLALRLADDVGDRARDRAAGQINLCEQLPPAALDRLGAIGGLSPERVVALRDALHALEQDGGARLRWLLVDALREAAGAVPESVATHHADYLRIARRLIELGMENIHGDVVQPVAVEVGS